MFGNYLKMAWRVLGRRKFFTFVSLFGIGFTLTTLMLVVALADHALAPSYPETQLDRMLVLDRMEMSDDRSVWSSSPGYKFLKTYSLDLPGVERMSIFSRSSGSTTFIDGRKLLLQTRYSDAEFWKIMQFSFIEGAAFGQSDDQNANKVAVISEDARRRIFGSDSALGKSLELDGNHFRVVGVVENVPAYRLHSVSDVWLPLGTEATVGFFDSIIGGCQAVYLLEPGADHKQVQAAFKERLTRVEFEDPERYNTMLGLPMTQLELFANLTLGLDTGETAPTQLVLFCILLTIVFMGLPAINLVNINLSRISERSAEIGVRKAFGASGSDLVMQFIVENIVLSLIGGLFSLLGAFLLLKLAPLFPQFPFLTFHLNWRIFIAALALATLFGLLSGTWPAWRMSRQHPVDALKGGI